MSFTNKENASVRDGESRDEWNTRRWRELWAQLVMELGLYIVIGVSVLGLAWLSS